MLGLWPKAEQVPREKLKCDLQVFTISLTFVIGILFPFVHSLIRIRKDIILVIEHLQFLLPTITCIIRLLIFWWKKEALTDLVKMIAEDWRKSKDEQERNMMIRWAQRPRVIITCAYTLMTICFILTVILPAFGISITYGTNSTNRDKMLPLQAYHIYDLKKRPQYELTYISQVIILFFTILAYTGIDNFLSLLVFHICGQLDILTIRLTCVSKLINFRNVLKICVIHHIRLLRAIDVVEDTYNIILLALFLYFGIFFAVYGFLIAGILEGRNDVSIIRLPYYICIAINIFVHMCLYCAVGEILLSQCNRMHWMIYNQKWYFLDPKRSKDLILLMIKTADPPCITAGKVFPMTMMTFCNLVKTSAGYISVLLTARN